MPRRGAANIYAGCARQQTTFRVVDLNLEMLIHLQIVCMYHARRSARERPSVQGAFIAVTSVAAIAAPLIGGAFTYKVP